MMTSGMHRRPFDGRHLVLDYFNFHIISITVLQVHACEYTIFCKLNC